ncbi:Formylglycine-generating enzyme, required for sulfatase activity, contains SUMF1/FGE domain [Flagellimonas taeanensis]|uniref:Formylglycine-generating enzyme, required for sulfatase activity, contains SUMF1/FGE domain n=1 Tax=Flagellimonas taeanensis TaxID=1005926 RepID=A0A1M6XFE6_9FLAO|nr:formylglycine-generating enzyme family protein [Allomuricauda taeanensis]SFB95252.1 Formylglycine-generating enzyme, required for sulfatase activity, contains SUMF1/FGE domain [Allomuricauda taeanensis]SHL04651.1 Formylglycine-generating enzyme, required for sulfatase activity, contains SUMF1/FGE domain [Allomuricauda taeanensis]
MFGIPFRAVFVCLVFQTFGFAQTDGMASIKGGRYIPLYGRDSSLVEVQDFELDAYPVTNGQFLQFLKDNPKWQKSNVLKLYADENYLRQFKNDTTLNDTENPNSPVTHVSWFAAKAYCECQGKRLPTIDEWEYVAMSDEVTADARKKASYNQKILSWYETPRTDERSIGKTPKNYWGIYDLHGLVWEWTLDFNSVLISGESRKDVDRDSNLFCGSAAIGATDLMNYAAFMRYAFRGSIKARYSIKNLGFRCAKNSTETL